MFRDNPRVIMGHMFLTILIQKSEKQCKILRVFWKYLPTGGKFFRQPCGFSTFYITVNFEKSLAAAAKTTCNFWSNHAITDLQICQFSPVRPLIGKSERLYVCVVVGCLIVTLATVLMLLWPLKMLKWSNFSLVSEVCSLPKNMPE